MQRIDLNTPTVSATPQSAIDENSPVIDNQRLNTSTYTSSQSMKNKSARVIAIASLIAILAGIGTGFGGYKLLAQQKMTSNETTQPVVGNTINKGDVFGDKDTDTFKDTAEGYLQKGGIDGEGSHSLIRPGGSSQTVYLTSSVTDLDALEGMEIKVWGETFKGQKAGWLMDVGRVEVLDPKAEAPIES